MSLVTFGRVRKAFGGEPVLDGVSFALGRRAKVGLVGENGSGKSTVLKLIAGVEEPDSGNVRTARSARLWYVPQMPELRATHTAYEEALAGRPRLFELRERMLSLERALGEGDAAAYGDAVAEFADAGGYGFEREAAEALRALGLGEETVRLPLARLSGGELARVALAKALLAEPTLLLLDEPDNHLDMQGIEWLEEALRRYRGALILVTHDRELLDRVVDSIVELEDGKATHEKGGLSQFLERKRERIERQKQQYRDQQRRVRRLHQALTRVDGKARAIDAGTRGDHLRRVGKMLARKAKILKRRIQRDLDGEATIEKPREQRDRMRVDLAPKQWHAQTVLRLEGVAKSFGGRRLFGDVDLELRRGQRLALVGPNGTGKTTLMEIALGLQEPDEGNVWVSQAAEAFYCDQHLGGLEPGLSVFDSVARDTDLDHTQVHHLLARMLFTGPALGTPVDCLSGGERTRLVLALLMNTRADLLLLDEPTNHLDLPSIEVLQDALGTYPGALLFISHDRRLVRAVATGVVELRDGRLEGAEPRRRAAGPGLANPRRRRL